jgi:uncharacterized protein (TIGR03067 family)
MKWVLLPAALTAGLFLAADAKDDAVKKDMDAIQGKWSVVSMDHDGDALKISKDANRVIKGDKYALTLLTDVTIEGVFTIDPTTSPKQIQTTASSGPYKDKELLGIYELNGDTLKFCFAPPGEKRPTEFKSKEGTGWILVIHKKVKE